MNFKTDCIYFIRRNRAEGNIPVAEKYIQIGTGCIYRVVQGNRFGVLAAPKKLVEWWELYSSVYNYLPFSNHGSMGRFIRCIYPEGIVAGCLTVILTSFPLEYEGVHGKSQ